MFCESNRSIILGKFKYEIDDFKECNVDFKLMSHVSERFASEKLLPTIDAFAGDNVKLSLLQNSSIIKFDFDLVSKSYIYAIVQESR